LIAVPNLILGIERIGSQPYRRCLSPPHFDNALARFADGSYWHLADIPKSPINVRFIVATSANDPKWTFRF